MANHSQELKNELDFIDTILECRNKYEGRGYSESHITERGGIWYSQEKREYEDELDKSLIFKTEINKRPVVAYYDFNLYQEIIVNDYDVEELKDNEKAFVSAMYLDTGEYIHITEIEKNLYEQIDFIYPKNYELINTVNNQSYSTIIYDQYALKCNCTLAQDLATQFEGKLKKGDEVLIKENGIDKYIGIYTCYDIDLTSIEEDKLVNGV